jgi:hypothetical protein
VGTDPLTKAEAPQDRLVDAARGIERDFLQTRAAGKPGLLESSGDPAVVTLGPLSVDQHSEALLESELVAGWTLQDLTERLRHRGQA